MKFIHMCSDISDVQTERAIHEIAFLKCKKLFIRLFYSQIVIITYLPLGYMIKLTTVNRI